MSMSDDHALNVATEGYDRVKYGVTSWQLFDLGEAKVRELLAKGKYGDDDSPPHRIASAWVESQDVQRKKEALDTSKQALANSKKATRLAAAALVLSIVMALQRVVEWYSR